MENSTEIETIVLFAGTFVVTLIGIIIIAFVLYHERNLRIKKISDELLKKQMEKEMYNALTQTQENEKLRIARNLHDEVKPMLAAIQNKLEFYETDHLNKSNRVPDYGNTIALVNKTCEIVEKTTRDLVPSFLTHEGLFTAFEFYVKQLGNTSLKVEFDNHLPDESKNYFSYNQRLQIYRVVLELFHNIIKHDNPKIIRVKIEAENNTVVFLFTHNGTGIDDASIQELKQKSQGLGLKSLHGRIELLNAKINYFKKPDVSGIKFAVPI